MHRSVVYTVIKYFNTIYPYSFIGLIVSVFKSYIHVLVDSERDPCCVCPPREAHSHLNDQLKNQTHPGHCFAFVENDLAHESSSSLGGKIMMMVLILIIVTFNQNKCAPWFARHSNPFQRSIRLDSVHRPEQWQQWEREILLSVIKMVVLGTPSVWCTSTKKRLRRTMCCLRWGKLRIFPAQAVRERTGDRLYSLQYWDERTNEWKGRIGWARQIDGWKQRTKRKLHARSRRMLTSLLRLSCHVVTFYRTHFNSISRWYNNYLQRSTKTGKNALQWISKA